MTDAPYPLHRQLGDARREQGLTQKQLAEQIGASQPAISMLESGRMDALSQEKIDLLAEVLGVASEAAGQPSAHRPALWYCPNPECPS